jgi:hypothetical protein
VLIAVLLLVSGTERLDKDGRRGAVGETASVEHIFVRFPDLPEAFSGFTYRDLSRKSGIETGSGLLTGGKLAICLYQRENCNSVAAVLCIYEVSMQLSRLVAGEE